MTLKIFLDFLISIATTVFFAILLKAPRKTVMVSAVLGGMGYVVFELSFTCLTSPLAAYFIGALFVSGLSEMLARFMKTPATIFIIPAIFPQVPGIGLYNTMMFLVDGKNSKAGELGFSTIIELTVMATALVTAIVLTRCLTALCQIWTVQRQGKLQNDTK